MIAAPRISAHIPIGADAAIAQPDAAPVARTYYEKRLRAALAAMILATLALILASLWANQARWRFDESLQNNLHAIDRISQLSDAVSAQAAAFRGHLVQREASSLLSYENSRESVPPMLEAVASDAAARPEQRITAAQLKEQLAELHAYYKDLSGRLISDGNAAAQDRYRSGTETERLAAIDETLATMRLQQERGLLLHNAGVQRRDNWLQLALGAALLAQFALGALLYWTLRGANRRRRAPAGS